MRDQGRDRPLFNGVKKSMVVCFKPVGCYYSKCSKMVHHEPDVNVVAANVEVIFSMVDGSACDSSGTSVSEVGSATGAFFFFFFGISLTQSTHLVCWQLVHFFDVFEGVWHSEQVHLSGRFGRSVTGFTFLGGSRGQSLQSR